MLLFLVQRKFRTFLFIIMDRHALTDYSLTDQIHFVKECGYHPEIERKQYQQSFKRSAQMDPNPNPACTCSGVNMERNRFKEF